MSVFWRFASFEVNVIAITEDLNISSTNSKRVHAESFLLT